MRDAASVIAQAVDNIIEDLAKQFEVGKRRMYEIVSTDNPYPKTKRLIRAINHCDKSVDKWRVKLIKADLDALFAELFSEPGEIDNATLHSELNDAVHAKLKGLCRADRLKECREAIAILNDEIAFLEREETKVFS